MIDEAAQTSTMVGTRIAKAISSYVDRQARRTTFSASTCSTYHCSCLPGTDLRPIVGVTDRRIGLCWEATRAPYQSTLAGGGSLPSAFSFRVPGFPLSLLPLSMQKQYSYPCGGVGRRQIPGGLGDSVTQVRIAACVRPRLLCRARAVGARFHGSVRRCCLNHLLSVSSHARTT
jgi:hypothetical protein